MAIPDPFLWLRIAQRYWNQLNEVETPESLRALFADPTVHRLERMYALQCGWMFRRHPDQVMPRPEWAAMFRAVGYFEMNEFRWLESCPQPTQTLRLFRGAPKEEARGMSWAWNRNYAALTDLNCGPP